MVTKSEANKAVNINVNGGSIIGSPYSQVALVSVREDMATFDFIYIHPQTETEGIVVARTTMPKKTALEFAEIITKTIKSHDEKLSSK